MIDFDLIFNEKPQIRFNFSVFHMAGVLILGLVTRADND